MRFFKTVLDAWSSKMEWYLFISWSAWIMRFRAAITVGSSEKLPVKSQRAFAKVLQGFWQFCRNCRRKNFYKLLYVVSHWSPETSFIILCFYFLTVPRRSTDLQIYTNATATLPSFLSFNKKKKCSSNSIPILPRQRATE